MTAEEKQLLLKDLCCRLPFGVKCNVQNDKINKDYVLTDIHTNGYGFDNKYGVFYGSNSFIVKPYLRPMSSMTDDEWEEYNHLKMEDWVMGDIYGVFYNAGTITDWLNKYMFDYRGLIPMGLALEAPKGMYKF